jgi:hypothetical protein
LTFGWGLSVYAAYFHSVGTALKELGKTDNRTVEMFTERRNMNKVVLAMVLGAVLGAFDGMTAWLTPEARAAILGIVVVGTVKGIIAGVFIGVFARKVHSLSLGIVFGLAVGLILAFVVAQLEHGYYLQIMLPGGMVGLIVGYATQKYGSVTQLRGV